MAIYYLYHTIYVNKPHNILILLFLTFLHGLRNIIIILKVIKKLL